MEAAYRKGLSAGLSDFKVNNSKVNEIDSSNLSDISSGKIDTLH